MLRKNQLLPLFSALVLSLSVVGSNFLIYHIFDRPNVLHFPTEALKLIYAGLIIAFTLLIWRLPLIQAETGRYGVVKALALGLAGGTINALYQILLARWLSEQNFIRPGLEGLGPIFFFAILYRLIYDRNPWLSEKEWQASLVRETNTCFESVSMIGLGGVLVIGSLVALVFFIHGDSPMTQRAIGIWLVGLGLLLLGFSSRRTIPRREQAWMQFAGLIMAISGLMVIVK